MVPAPPDEPWTAPVRAEAGQVRDVGGALVVVPAAAAVEVVDAVVGGPVVAGARAAVVAHDVATRPSSTTIAAASRRVDMLSALPSSSSGRRRCPKRPGAGGARTDPVAAGGTCGGDPGSGGEVLGTNLLEEFAEPAHQLVGVRRLAVVLLVVGGQHDPLGVHELVGHVQRAPGAHGQRHSVRGSAGDGGGRAVSPQMELE